MDRTRKVLDSLDSGDVTDRTDRTQKANDPCEVTMVTARKRANSGDITKSMPAPHGSSQSTSSASINYCQTGMTGGTAIRSNVAAVMTVNNAECSLLQHLITETELKIKSRDPTRHVSTYTERAAFRHLKACGSVIIRGRSGSGKSHLGYTLLERVEKSCSRIPVKVSSPDEWNYIHKSNTSDAKNYVVMVDDIFGRTNLIQSSLDDWRQKFDLVWPLVESGQIWLVMTSRPEIISEGEPEIFGYEVINKAKEIILDEGKYRLREAEKLKFLDKLCGKYVRQEDMEEIANIETALGFPQCCTFFAANKDARLKGVEFFKKPFEFIQHFIECVKKNQPEVYFVLLLVFMNEGELSMKELMSIEHEDKFERQFKTIMSHCRLRKACPSKAGIKDVAKSVCGVFLLESFRCFLFSHRSIYDVLFVAVCEDSPALGIRMSTPVMLLEFIRINKRKLERCKQHNVVFLDEEDYPILADKLREYLSYENTRYIVLSHPAFEETKFLRVIFHEWNADDMYQLCWQNGEKVVKHIALPLSEKLGLPETVNILEYNLFLSYVIMNHMKEFASRVIQLLCSYYSEDIQPVLNEALLCALYTCEQDLATTLLSRGAKPNMLCFISLCNWPQLDTNTSSTIISQIEDNETNLKLLLSIAVISCNKTVIRVLIRKLISLSGNHEQFYSHCLELLLKINGNGHKGITQMIPNAGHEILEVMTFLEEGGGKLDSRKISLASSHKDPSVLRKLLLRSPNDIHVTDEYGRTPLHLACMYGGADGVELLLKHGSELSVDKEGSTPFHYALKSCVDQKEKLKLLLNKNSTNDEDFVNLTDHMKRTALHYAVGAEAQADIPDPLEMWSVYLQGGGKKPLHCAAKNVCMECVTLLLPLSDVNAQDSECNTALHFSSLSDQPHCHEVIQALLEKEADAGIKNKKGATPFHCAARNRCMECVELLLPVSDVNAQDSHGNTPLHFGFYEEHYSHEVKQALLEKGADAGIKNKYDHTPLHLAALNGCDECVELLLPFSDRNAQECNGNTPLHCSFWARGYHSHEVTQALLEKEADAGIKNKEGETPLHCAARKSCDECVELLLSLSSVNVQDGDGHTPLHCVFLDTIKTGMFYWLQNCLSHEVLQALLEKKPDGGIKNNTGETPLHYAAQTQCKKCVDLLLPLSDVNAQESKGNTALHKSFLFDQPHSHGVIQALLEKGADVRIKNKEGLTPLHHAAQTQCKKCVDLLLPLSDVNAQESKGNTALHISFLSDQPHSRDVIQALLEKGADVRIKNKKGLTPHHCASFNGSMEFVKLLLPLSDVNAQDSIGYTALHYILLIKTDHCHDKIQALLEKKADVKIKNKEGQTPLHCAAGNHCMECVKLLLPLSDVNAHDSGGDTALHYSVSPVKPFFHEVIQALLERVADVRIKTKVGQTPLFSAALILLMEYAKLLLPLSDVNAQDSDGNTALHTNVLSDQSHSHEVQQALLEKGADVRIKNKEGQTPLHYAAWTQCKKCVELLLPLSDVNAQDSNGNTALHINVLSDQPPCHEVIQALLEKGADVRIKNKEGQTPLHYAARTQCKKCVDLLLPLSDVSAKDSDGNSALHISFLSDQSHSHEVIQALLEKGADVRIKNKEGQTPLHYAAQTQCIECVKLLLPLSDVNAQDSEGDTALHISFLSDQSHSHEVIQALLEKGADVRIKNKEGQTPLHYAAQTQCIECVKLLLPLSDVNAQDSDVNTALHYSFLSDQPPCHEVLQALLEKGADVRIKNKKGATPLHYAARTQCKKCVDLLLPLSDVNTLDSDGNTALH